MEIIIAHRFKLVKKIGGGAFGQIYEGLDLITQDQVSVKLEHMTVKYPQLLYEAKILRLLQGNEGIPMLFWAGQEGEYNVMVLELLGPSLEDLFQHCGRKFSLKTTLLLAKQMISRLEYFHSRQFVHRDIKPDNFLVGMGQKSDVIYLIDYGLSKRFIDPKSGQHIPFREGKALTGTARYTSLNNHLGYEQSRRDDLEGLAYVLIYFARGQLPWMGIGGNSKTDKYMAIMEMKRDLPFRQVSQELPIEFEDLLRYCRALKFTDRPDYSYIKKMLDAVFYRANFVDFQFDWKILNNKKLIAMSKNLETQFLATEALERRKRYGDKYDVKFPPIKPDPKAIAKHLKKGILNNKEYNYEDPDNDDDFSRGGRRKYNDGDDDEYGEEDYEDDDDEEEPDEDLKEEDHDKIYPQKQKQQQSRPKSQIQQQNKQLQRSVKQSLQPSKLPSIQQQKSQQILNTKSQLDDVEDEEYDDEEDGEYDDGEDDDIDDKTGLRSVQSRARNRLNRHLNNNSQANSVISNTMMKDLKVQIDRKLINQNSNNGPYDNNIVKPKSMRASARSQNNRSNKPVNKNRSDKGDIEEERIKIKDLTNQLNRGIRDMNKSVLDAIKKKPDPVKRSITPLKLQPIMKNEKMLPDQPYENRQIPQQQKNPPPLINLANKTPQNNLQLPKQQPQPPNNNKNNAFVDKNSQQQPSNKANTKRSQPPGLGTTKGNNPTKRDSLRLNEMDDGEDFEEELEEDYEDDEEDDIQNQTKQQQQ